MTTTVLIVVNVFAALAIIVLALMQQSKGDMGSAFGGGGSQSMFGSRGSANFLSRMTSLMCAVFFISSLSLAYTYAKRADANSVVDNTSVLEQVEANNEVPTLDAAPVVEEADNEVPTLDAAPEVDSADVNEAVEAIDDAAQETTETVEDAATDAVEKTQ